MGAETNVERASAIFVPMALMYFWLRAWASKDRAKRIFFGAIPALLAFLRGVEVVTMAVLIAALPLAIAWLVYSWITGS